MHSIDSWIIRLRDVLNGLAALFAYLTTDFERRWEPGTTPSRGIRAGHFRKSRLRFFPQPTAGRAPFMEAHGLVAVDTSKITRPT